MTATHALSIPAHENEQHLIASARERFRRGGEIEGDVVRPVIADSWRRCRAASISCAVASAPLRALPAPVSAEYALPARRALREASLPIVAEAPGILSKSGTMLALADASGVVLGTYGDAAVVDAAAAMGLMAGGEWSERLRGTNAIGTALAAGGPVHVHGAEHYCEASIPWTCSGTVARDPVDGSVLAAVSVAGPSEAFNPHLLALVMAIAARLESTLAMRETAYRERLLDRALGKISRSTSHGLIVFDRKGRFITADARAGVALAAMDVAPNLEAYTRIDALDFTSGHRHEPDTLPDWLRSEWMEPVAEGEERIGTLVLIPESFRQHHVPNGRLPRYRLRRATEFIESHLDRMIHIEEVARVAGLSRYHFHRQFKQSTGLPPHQYILRKRVERAKVLLANSDLPIIDVAAQVGFADQSHFTTLFRRRTSLTPKAYRHATKA